MVFGGICGELCFFGMVVVDFDYVGMVGLLGV